MYICIYCKHGQRFILKKDETKKTMKGIIEKAIIINRINHLSIRDR